MELSARLSRALRVVHGHGACTGERRNWRALRDSERVVRHNGRHWILTIYIYIYFYIYIYLYIYINLFIYIHFIPCHK